jgi:hypothetical protein
VQSSEISGDPPDRATGHATGYANGGFLDKISRNGRFAQSGSSGVQQSIKPLGKPAIAPPIEIPEFDKNSSNKTKRKQH